MSDRYTVQPVSVGEAGLTSRPAVVDSQAKHGPRVVKIYRRTDQQLAERAAVVLNQLDRRGTASTGDLRMRASVAEWGFDPRPVVRSLARAGVVEELWSGLDNQTKWAIKD